MKIKELTKEQEQAIREAYFKPAGKVKTIVDRIKAAGVPVETATGWLVLHSYIGYNDKLLLDRMA